jgi:sec-independent protein translocase protein TatB
MEFLGIGPSELLFIIIIALIVLGPRDMQKAGRTIGKWLRRIVTSDGWKLFQQTSREIQTLPNRLMREAALEELQEMQKDLQKDMRQPFEIKGRPSESSQQATPQTALPTEPSTDPTSNTENRILPPPAPPATPATPAGDEEAHG